MRSASSWTGSRGLDEGAARDGAGVLVDEEFGSDLAHDALSRGWICAMPAERSGLCRFELEYGDDFGRHIEAFDPTFTKILVRYNPDGDPSDNERSRPTSPGSRRGSTTGAGSSCAS